ncbi:signal peptidase I [Aeromicrobium sp.]|uniref:signal peptidase I n=1 Tax=Aeromicrobium sp. TaxID=1871063 RepID=UPI0030BFBEA3
MAEAGRRRARSSARTAWFWRSALLVVAALLGLLFISSTIVVLAAGLTPIAFDSGSMEPAISSGDLVLARKVSAGDVGVGDIVSVDDRRGTRVTHRVTTVEPYGASIRLTLKADASGVPDVESYEVTSVDKVVAVIPWVGFLVGSPIGAVAGAVFIACLAAKLPRRHMGGTRRTG